MLRVTCPKCNTNYRFDEALLGGKARAQAKCRNCGAPIEIRLEDASSLPAPKLQAEAGSENRTARAQRMRADQQLEKTADASQAPAAEALALPVDKKYSLAVLQGKSSGQIFPITKSRTTIGRAGTDIVLDDPECSRQHAALEIRGTRASVSDLKSTNGTYVNGKRTERADLENHGEFRVGDHVMMFIVTDRE